MQIKTRLYLSSIISICLIAIFVFVVALTSNKIAKESKKYQLAHHIHLVVSQLDIITYEYLMHREKRMEQQWHSIYASTAGILAVAKGEIEGKLVESICVDYTASGDLFSEVTLNYRKIQELIQEGAAQEKIEATVRLEERLVAQLLIRSQSIITNAYRLDEKSMAGMIKTQELAKNLTLFLVLILVVIVTITTLMVNGIISKSLAKLEKGAEIIGKGNFQHRIDMKRKDEMGRLATAFNQMTSRLQEFYTGLEEEIAERKRAQEELKEAQEQLVFSEKLAVLGQLAGGMGHELGNPLGAIKCAVYFLKGVLEKPCSDVKETLDILDREVERCQRIIANLFDFVRSKSSIWRKADINELIRETLSRVSVPENVEVMSQLDEAVPRILIDPDQLIQVIENLVLNAIQAMPQGGRLTIKSGVPSLEWVAVSFSDTGGGIPDENLKKVFEPFFTTRAKGIGLGLVLTKSLIERHGGTIEVESEVGEGSIFTIRLPVSTEKAMKHE